MNGFSTMVALTSLGNTLILSSYPNSLDQPVRDTINGIPSISLSENHSPNSLIVQMQYILVLPELGYCLEFP